jgi:hypothetical protein
MDQTVVMREERDSGGSHSYGYGKAVMDSARELAGRVSAIERQRLAERDALRIRNLALGVSWSALSVPVAFLINRSIRTDVITQQRAHEQLEHRRSSFEEQAIELEHTMEQLRETTPRGGGAAGGGGREPGEERLFAVMSYELRTPPATIVAPAAGPVAVVQMVCTRCQSEAGWLES